MNLADTKKRHQGMAALVLKLKNKPVEETEEVKDEEVDSSMALDSAVEDMMSAVESKDSSKFKAALRSFISICMDEPEEEDESEEEQTEE